MDDKKNFKEHVSSLGITLPEPPSAKGVYLPVARYGNLIFTSGTGANINGQRLYTGKVGGTVTLEDARKSAYWAVLNNISNIYSVIGEDIRNLRILKLTGYVNSEPDFIQQAKVIDGASEVLVDIFGDNGRHARSAIGVASLPFSLSVEIELVAEIMDTRI